MHLQRSTVQSSSAAPAPAAYCHLCHKLWATPPTSWQGRAGRCRSAPTCKLPPVDRTPGRGTTAAPEGQGWCIARGEAPLPAPHQTDTHKLLPEKQGAGSLPASKPSKRRGHQTALIYCRTVLYIMYVRAATPQAVRRQRGATAAWQCSRAQDGGTGRIDGPATWLAINSERRGTLSQSGHPARGPQGRPTSQTVP